MSYLPRDITPLVRYGSAVHLSNAGAIHQAYDFNNEKTYGNVCVYRADLERKNEEFSALCSELDVASQGSNSKEARQKLLGAAVLHLEGSFEAGLPYLRPVPAIVDPRNSQPAEEVEFFKFKVDVTIKAYV